LGLAPKYLLACAVWQRQWQVIFRAGIIQLDNEVLTLSTLLWK
jgi:hypothetical protein